MMGARVPRVRLSSSLASSVALLTLLAGAPRRIALLILMANFLIALQYLLLTSLLTIFFVREAWRTAGESCFVSTLAFLGGGDWL